MPSSARSPPRGGRWQAVPTSRSCGWQQQHRYESQGSGQHDKRRKKAYARPLEVLLQRTGKISHPSHPRAPSLFCARLPSASQLPTVAGVNPSERSSTSQPLRISCWCPLLQFTGLGDPAAVPEPQLGGPEPQALLGGQPEPAPPGHPLAGWPLCPSSSLQGSADSSEQRVKVLVARSLQKLGD